jgi:predicted aldo/keto reductase-like oxidoreductase
MGWVIRRKFLAKQLDMTETVSLQPKWVTWPGTISSLLIIPRIYSRACEQSLKRLKRETIDYYQLHSARVDHLQNGECIEAMRGLQKRE